MANYPLPKICHPDFSTPGRKPLNARLDSLHPLSNGVVLYSFDNHDLVSNTLPLNPVEKYKSTPWGKLPYYPGDNAAEYTRYEKQALDSITDQLTVSLLFIPDFDSSTDPDTGGQHLIDTTDSNSEGFRIFWGIGGATEFLFRLITSGGYTNHNVTPNAFAAGDLLHLVFRYDGANLTFWQNGVQVGGSTAKTGNMSAVIDHLRIGQTLSSPIANECAHGAIDNVIIHNRALSCGEICSLANDPYQALKPSVDLFYFTSAAASGTTVNATLGTIGATANTATVNAATAIAATLGTIDASTFAATVSIGTTINGTTPNIDVSTYAATINTATSVNATLANTDITAYQATVTLGTSTNVNATTGTIDVSTFAATVSAPLVVAASVGGVSATAYRASVQSAALATNTGGNYDFLNPPTRKTIKAAKTIQRVAKKQVERETKKGKPAPKSYQISELKRALKKQQIELEEEHKKQLETARDQAIDDAIQQQLILQDLITHEKQHQLESEQADMQIMLMMLSAL